MGTFDPYLIKLNNKLFPNLVAGETIGTWSRITKTVDGKRHICVVWNNENCKNCKETDCAFFRRRIES